MSPLRRVPIALCLVLPACRASDAERPDAHSGAPTTPEPVRKMDAGHDAVMAPEASEVPNEEDDDACMKTCLERHQAQAVAFEMIEASCRRSCTERTPAQGGPTTGG